MTDLPNVKLKALVQFPANVYGGTGVEVIKANQNYTLNLEYGDFMPVSEDLPTGLVGLVWDPTGDVYYLAPLEFTGGIGIPEAPTDGSQYGRQSSGWSVITSVSPATAIPLVESGTGAVGVAVKYAREDHVHPASGGIDQNSQSTNYTTVLSDAQKHMLHPTADTTARTFTIAANASVAYPIGTAISFVNQHGAGVLTIACGDTMYLASAGTTGNRTLAASGVCTALKITTTEWIISGKGLT